MNWYVLTALLIVVSMGNKTCSKTKENNIPGCIQAKIDSIKNAPKWNPPAEVRQYTYLNKTVYLFSSNCCDQYNVVWDNDCHYVCAPTGGLTGKGDGRCADFEANAQLIRIVWKDDR